MTKKIIVSILITFFLCNGFSLFCEPGTEQVKKRLQAIRKELGLEKREQKEKSRGDNKFLQAVDDFLNNLFRISGKILKVLYDFFAYILRPILDMILYLVRFLSGLGPVIVYTTITAVAAAAAFFLYKISRGLMENRDMPKEDISSTEKKDLLEYTKTTDELYQRAKVYAERGDFGPAVMMLHKATVRYLLDVQIISSSKEYTNNELKQLIRQEPFFDSFAMLALHSEIVKFKHTIPGRELYEKLRNRYMSIIPGET